MFGNRAYLDEAIADAERLVKMVPGVAYCVVTRPHGQFRAVRRHPHIKPERIKWRSWGLRPHNPVPNTPENEAIVSSNQRKVSARLLGCSLGQLDYAMAKYGWKAPHGTHIDLDELREAMKEMTAHAYAVLKGVYDERIYFLCRKHGIPRPVRDKKGRKNVET